MKSKRTLLALLVALLAFVAVMSVASGQKVEMQKTGTNDRIGTLQCRGGPSTRAEAVFHWTKKGEKVGDSISFRCRIRRAQSKRLVYPRGADDFSVTMMVRDKKTGSRTWCDGIVEYPRGKVPPRFGEYCYLERRQYAIFTIK